MGCQQRTENPYHWSVNLLALYASITICKRYQSRTTAGCEVACEFSSEEVQRSCVDQGRGCQLLLFASERISFRMLTVKGIAWKTTKIQICVGVHVDVYDFALIRVSALSGQLNVNTLYRQNILSLCLLTFLFWPQGLCIVRQPGFGQALNCASAYFLQLILSSCALHHLKH